MTNVVNYLNNEQSKKDGKAKKQNYETVSNYINFLEDAFVILRADRYDVKGKEILKGAAKYYANDNSYHNYLYEGYGYGQGALLENYVYQALRRAGFQIYAGKMANREVDFVCADHDKRLYDSYPKILVTMDDIPFKNRKGIENIQAWRLEEFLGH